MDLTYLKTIIEILKISKWGYETFKNKINEIIYICMYVYISVNQILVVGTYNTQYEHKNCQLQHVTSSYMEENTLQ